ncbi:MAG: radical SAM protein, partial [Clostridia bacterium]|nr:radical SAM protein [Clostridia bacterium]
MYSRVYVEITNICNMNCSFCHGHSRPPHQMTEAEYARILEQLRGKTEYIYHHLMGEPLVHPLLPRFIQMANRAGFHPMITTNGTLLDRGGDELLANGLYKANISLHSFEEGSSEEHLSYLEKIADFIDKAENTGTIISLRFWNNGCDGGKNKPALDFFKERFPLPWTENTRGFRLREKLFIEWGERFDWPDKNAPNTGNSLYCRGLIDHFGILCDGTVVPCCLDSEGGIPLGNAFTGELSEILNSDEARAIAEGFRRRQAARDL